MIFAVLDPGLEPAPTPGGPSLAPSENLTLFLENG